MACLRRRMPRPRAPRTTLNARRAAERSSTRTRAAARHSARPALQSLSGRTRRSPRQSTWLQSIWRPHRPQNMVENAIASTSDTQTSTNGAIALSTFIPVRPPCSHPRLHWIETGSLRSSRAGRAAINFSLICRKWGARAMAPHRPCGRTVATRHSVKAHLMVLAQHTQARPPLAQRKIERNQEVNGDPGRIRTCDHRLRRPVLYPAELRDRRHRSGRCLVLKPALAGQNA